MRKTYLLCALLFAAVVGTTAANAGMSGTSDRVQQQSVSAARAAVQPHQQPQPTRALHPTAKPVQQQSSVNAFDGAWSVTSSGCGLAGRSGVRVSRGRIIGDGLSGSIDANGNVRTVASGGGLSVVSTGKASGSAASGNYRVSNGCTGTWVAHKR